VTPAQVQAAVDSLLASKKDDLASKKYGIYGELLGSLTKDKLKWADPKEVKAALDATLEKAIGPRDAQPLAAKQEKPKEVIR
jgi:hypothetical protein